MKTEADLPKALADEYACVAIRGEEYGVRTSRVRSVVNMPAVRRVPRAPSFIEGVANIGGRIVPLINSIERLGLSGAAPTEERPEAGKRLVLFQVEHSLYGLMADGVRSISPLTAGMIEPVNPLIAGKDASFIAGMARFGERLIYLLDTEAFVTAGLEPDREERAAYEAFSARMSASLERAQAEVYRRFLTLSIGEEEYGIESSELREVIPAERMEAAPGGPGYLAGMVQTSGGALPVIDLQEKFDLDSSPYPPGSRVVIVDAGEFSYGVLAHSVTEFLNITDEEIREAPAAISGESIRHIRGVGMPGGGERLVLLLDAARMLEDEEVEILAERDDIRMYQKERESGPGKGEAALSFVVFRVQDMEFAFHLKDLSEVIQYREATRVPGAPAFIRGLVSVGGELVPVMDLRRRFGLTDEGGGETRMLVLGKGEAAYGVAADSVSEILRVSGEDVAPAPEIVKGVDSMFVEGVIRIKDTDRAPLILNVEALFEG